MSTQTMEKTTFLSNFNIKEFHLAHTPKETLLEHSLLTFKYYEKLVKSKSLTTLIDSLIKQVDEKNFVLIKEMFENAILLHDLGKKNPGFQAKKMDNEAFKEHQETPNSKHSKQGALEYLEYYINFLLTNIEDANQFHRLIYILYSFAYTIDKHHGKLSSFESFCSETSEMEEKHIHLCNAKGNYKETYENKKFELYILSKLLFSLLISSDYYATTEYMAFKNKQSFEDFGVLNKEKKRTLKNLFEEHIKSFPKATGINKLREEMCQEATKNLKKNTNKNIFYLEAPTGSGKTLTSINLALELFLKKEELNKLFYIFPFNTLVEQSKNVFDKIFENELDIEVINSITPIKEYKNQEDKESNYEKSYINRLFFNSPAIITTHVNFFDILFGTSKEDNFPLWQLCNSVIILDEIQSYNNDLWWYMIEFFEKYAKALNLKIIIMSATLPKLDYFIQSDKAFVSLISDEKRDYFFNHHYFKDRVKIEYLNKEGKNTLEELQNKLKEESQNYKKILFEFISKKTARKFYNNLIKDGFEEVYELSGDDNKAYRQYVINKTKEKNGSLIIVATQVIEAGVDIDMDLGFKDISILDSEEQFMGRINRSCEKKHLNPKVYFFDFDEASKIYKNDNKLGYDLHNEIYRKILKNKEFSKYYKKVFEDIKRNILRTKGLKNHYQNFLDAVQNLDFKTISQEMKLINSNAFTLYFPFKINLEEFKNVKEFESIPKHLKTDDCLDGQKVWDEFLALHEIESFAKKKIKKSRINSLMQFFTFSIYKHYEDQFPVVGEESYGFYFVENLDLITKENKFDRDTYNTIANGHFL